MCSRCRSYWCCSSRSTSGGSARTAASRGPCRDDGQGGDGMTWEESPKDMAAYQQELDAQLAAGTDRRIAEGRARSKAIRAYRVEHPDELEERPAQAPAAAAA